MNDRSTAEAGGYAASTAEIIDGLSDLLQLDHDALGAYAVAIEKLQDRDHANQIAGFRRDHERHIRDLDALISELGGTPRHEPHATGPFKEALQSLGGLAGDKGILMAWRTNELQVRTKYDNYASRATFWPDGVKRVIDHNALDEERHYDWVVGVLQRMGIGPGSDLETAAATRLREAGTQFEGLKGRARETAAEMGAAARNRIASTLDTTAERLEDVAAQRPAVDDRLGQATHGLASGMHSGARYLRNADMDHVRTDLERSVHDHPLRTLVILFGTGFVIGRLLR